MIDSLKISKKLCQKVVIDHVLFN